MQILPQLNSATRISKTWPGGFSAQNLRIVIAVKVMVNLKNLFWLKDGLGPCLKDANITQPFYGEFQQQIHHLYSEYGGYNSERGRRGPSQSAPEHRRDSTSCKEQETDHSYLL
jgi:hypothetical protein